MGFGVLGLGVWVWASFWGLGFRVAGSRVAVLD